VRLWRFPRGGRYREFSFEIEHILVDWVVKKACDNKVVNRTKLWNPYVGNFRTAITRGWIDSLMSRYAAELLKRTVPLKKIKDLKCHESSRKLRLRAYEPMSIMSVQSLSVISIKLELVDRRTRLKAKWSFHRPWENQKRLSWNSLWIEAHLNGNMYLS
jgi:hypothetical protein